MVDEVDKKIAEAKAKMFGNQQPSGGKILTIIKGDARVETTDPKIQLRKA